MSASSRSNVRSPVPVARPVTRNDVAQPPRTIEAAGSERTPSVMAKGKLVELQNLITQYVERDQVIARLLVQIKVDPGLSPRDRALLLDRVIDLVEKPLAS
jgi:hypothetical protein